MSAPGIDQRAHATAWRTMIDDLIDPGQAFDRDEVPGLTGNPHDLPDLYCVIDITRRFVELARLTVDSSGWRVLVTVVGGTPYAVRAALSKIATVEGKRLVIGAAKSTPIAHQNTEDAGPDDGRFSASVEWTYAL